MRDLKKFFKLIFAGMFVCGLPYSTAHASPMRDVPGSSGDYALPVLTVDGADRDTGDGIGRRPDSSKGPAFDFGFVHDGQHTSITGKSHARFSGSRHPEIARGDFRESRFGRDRDDGGTSDIETWIEAKRNRCDDIPPPVAAVPVPSAAWSFGAGLLALATALKRRKDFAP